MFGEAYFTETIDNFSTSVPRTLFGDQLRDVNDMQASIKLFGLLSPITVHTKGRKLIVVDGHKRVAALRRMQVTGDLPDNLQTLPYVIINTERARRIEKGQVCLPMLSNEQKYNLVMDLADRGLSAKAISFALYIELSTVENIININEVCEEIQTAFFQDRLSLKQAHAFAAIPNVKAQNKLLKMMDEQQYAPTIAHALENGKTVIDLGGDNIIVLPSRKYVAA